MSKAIHEPTCGAMSVATMHSSALHDLIYSLSRWPEGHPGRIEKVREARKEINRLIELFEPSRAQETRDAA